MKMLHGLHKQLRYKLEAMLLAPGARPVWVVLWFGAPFSMHAALLAVSWDRL
jgi:hypothetical protein